MLFEALSGARRILVSVCLAALGPLGDVPATWMQPDAQFAPSESSSHAGGVGPPPPFWIKADVVTEVVTSPLLLSIRRCSLALLASFEARRHQVELRDSEAGHTLKRTDENETDSAGSSLIGKMSRDYRRHTLRLERLS